MDLKAIAEKFLSGTRRAILKIDIEGHEWPVFGTAPDAVLERFSQIVGEFHSFERLLNPAWHDGASLALKKLKSAFEVVHVHGNNNQSFANVANVILPSLLEVTFANRKFYRFEESNEVFPTELDQPNIPSQPDLFLGCFKF